MRKLATAISIAMLAAATLGSAALAEEAPIARDKPRVLSDIEFDGPGPSLWDLSVDEDGNMGYGNGYSPIDDGEYDGEDDAFDGGLIAAIDGQAFPPKEITGNIAMVEGRTVTVGPFKVNGVKATRRSTYLKSSPTMRDILSMYNPGTRDLRVTVSVGTDLGSDSGTVLQATSSGDAIQTADDRWLVSTQNAAAPFDDPPVTQVLYGKGAQTPVKKVPTPVVAGSDSMEVRYKVMVPAGATRSLMFFAQMHDADDTGLVETLAAAKKFNKRGLNGKLLTDIPPAVMATIVNWDLT